MDSIVILIIILVAWNLAVFTLMGIDKNKAIKGRRRISEKSLFLCSFLLGGIGALGGMYVFRHKTKHLSFKILVPLAVITNAVIYYYLIKIL